MNEILFIKFQSPTGCRILVNLAKVHRIYEDSEQRCFVKFNDGEVEISGTIEDALKNIIQATRDPRLYA